MQENTIRHKNQALSYLKLSSRLDAVAARLQTAQNLATMTSQIDKVVKIVGGTIKTMDFEKVSRTAAVFFSNTDDALGSDHGDDGQLREAVLRARCAPPRPCSAYFLATLT